MIDPVIPQNREAEAATLGGMMLESWAIGEVAQMLKSEDFMHPAHVVIFSAFVELYERYGDAGSVDVLMLKDHLESGEGLEAAGGVEYLEKIAGELPSSGNVTYYASIVRDKAVLRRIMEASAENIQQAQDLPQDIPAFLDECECRIFQVAERGEAKTTETIGELLKGSLAKLDSLAAKPIGDEVTGLTTGYRDLDRMIDGFHPGELIILAARPSMGKTTLALNMAIRASTVPASVLVFSCEMSRDQIAMNILCTRAGVDAHRMRRGQFSEHDWAAIAEAAGNLTPLGIHIDDTPALSTLGLRAKARRTASKYGLDLVIVDYLQLLTSGKKFENRQTEISTISRSLKQLARELKVPVLALSQLNRGVDARDDKRPRMSDLRESGAIEQDADVVMFIYRDEKYNPTPENQNVAEIIVDKQRCGPTGTVKLMFYGQTLRFEGTEYVDPKEF